MNSISVAVSELSAMKQKELQSFFSNLNRLFKQVDPNRINLYGDALATVAGSSYREQFASVVDPAVLKKIGVALTKNPEESIVIALLDIIRSSGFLQRLKEDKAWSDLILQLMGAIDYTFPKMFRHRTQSYLARPLFTTVKGKTSRDYTWREISDRVSLYARGLFGLMPRTKGKVAFFCENSLDMALFDLACLSSGIINIMIPANAVPAHVEFIMTATKPEVVIVSGQEYADIILNLKAKLPFIKAIVVLSARQRSLTRQVITVDRLVELASNTKPEVVEAHTGAVKISDLATIMFTSGTTGNPKGIMFSHQNIVFKRFARAMALPAIGENDRFLSYLPLYHTFGRWLEMTGAIFWGARYIFMENPAPETMIDNMGRFKPTIFISIPKKWYQLYEYIATRVDLERSEHQEIRRAVHEVTGGCLKWGLSAAGHLDAEIFQFFQRYGIELISGFGMTEATGGITMTRPGKYLPGSLGSALPGIEIKLESDGELLIRGPYVMPGYFNPEKEDLFVDDGWLPTGDIMQYLEDGAIQLVDRKKEIYKNIKGETIAPQKIENYFRDFDFIRHVFLVGDHKPFNTLLIYPNYDSEDMDFSAMKNAEIRTYFSSVVESVNRFLAPYERIVNFAIIDRDFSLERHELTPKGTYRRKVIETNFSGYITTFYNKKLVTIKHREKQIALPDWFLREFGITIDHIVYTGSELILENKKESLSLAFQPQRIQIGNFFYNLRGTVLDLGKVFTTPALWLGNQDLVSFCGKNIFFWYRNESGDPGISISGITATGAVAPKESKRLAELLEQQEISLEGLHLASRMMFSSKKNLQSRAIFYLKQSVQSKRTMFSDLGIHLLRQTIHLPMIALHQSVFKIVIENFPVNLIGDMTRLFMDNSVNLMSENFMESLCDLNLSIDRLKPIFNLLWAYNKENNNQYKSLLKFLVMYGSRHPQSYQRIRAFFVSCQLDNRLKKLNSEARKAQLNLRDGFRKWLGAKQNLAVDVETGAEYRWDDVIIFEENCNNADAQRIRKAIKSSALIREAVFIFSGGVLIRLSDILPGGIWISLLGKRHGKSVYRVSIQTRFQGSFDIAINLNHNLTNDQILEEIRWLIQTGVMPDGRKLAENFGGHWEEFDLWTEEFIPGETAGRMVRRLLARGDDVSRERICELWPYFIWSGITAYVNFWLCTGKQMMIGDPSPENLIIPAHDYQVGTRIVAISSRKNYRSAKQMLKVFCTYYIQNTEKKYPQLKGIGRWKYVFSGILEALGADEGIAFLKKIKPDNETLSKEINQYCFSVSSSGFIPRRLYFAIQRFLRWNDLNKDATYLAKAAMLRELCDTYKLQEMEEHYPELHTRLYTDTVFACSKKPLKQALEAIITGQREEGFDREQLAQTISHIQKELNLTGDERYFLTRLPYPHLAPDDKADIIAQETGGTFAPNLMVQLEDYEGKRFYIREAVNPKEITRLHQLFLQNNLAVLFRPEHLYLLAVNDRGHLIGGLFYLKQNTETVHIEKIVVGEFYRKKGVSDGILREFFKRMKVNKFRYVTTGFFRPEYFYRFGFKIERKYAGLVKDLLQNDE